VSTLLRRREVAVWGVCLLAVWALLVATGFVSRDPDSAFYAVMTERLANGPASAWIAPEWGGLWNGTGLWQEHPIGIYLAPIGLAWIGAAHWTRGGPAEAIDGIVFILLLFLCVLLHEFGHIFAARRYGIRTRFRF